jgi:hypothetical protein
MVWRSNPNGTFFGGEMNFWDSTLVGGAFGGFAVAYSKAYFDARSKVDENLRNNRLETYEEMWRAMSLLPKWPRNPEVTRGSLHAFSEWLRDWYFGTEAGTGALDSERKPGGMFLSTSARKRYTFVQEAIVKVVGSQKDDEPISDTDYQVVMTACSHLRSAMTEDLLSRRGAPFRLADWARRLLRKST